MAENKKVSWWVGTGIVLLVTIATAVMLIRQGNPQPPPSEKTNDVNTNKQAITDTFSHDRAAAVKPLPLKVNPILHNPPVLTEKDKLVQDFLKPFKDADYKLAEAEHLERVKPRDLELWRQFDLSPEELAQTPTDKLLFHMMRTPMFVGIVESNDRVSTGARRLLNASQTMQEFYRRDDIAPAVLKFYQEYDLSPESISDEECYKYMPPQIREKVDKYDINHYKIAKLGLDIRSADGVIMSDIIMPRLQGYERQFIEAMYDRHEKIKPLSDKYSVEGVIDYGGALSRVTSICLENAKKLDNDLYTTLTSIPKGKERLDKFWAEIKRYLGK